MNPIAAVECEPSKARAPRKSARPPAQLSERAPLRHDLRAMLVEGAAASLMVGIGETYLPAFALAMGVGQVAAGLITTVPLMSGALLQLISPRAVQYLGSHRRWVVICATLQALSFVSLALAAAEGTIGVFALFVAASIYWGCGLATSPAWSTWAERLVPGRIRAHYFARRTRVAQFATLLGFVLGGIALQIGAGYDRRLLAFAGLFLLAAIGRLISVACLASQSESRPLGVYRQVSLREFFVRMRNSASGRLLFYLLCVQAAAQIAGPYFTPYMLGPRGMSYTSYVTLIGVSFAAKALALPAFGRLAHRCGTRRLLVVGGLGIVPVSGLWLISNSFAFLVGVQVLAGVTWAAYELATFLIFFETIRPEERTSVLTSFNFANSLATVAGSLLGGALLTIYGKNEQVYLLLFGLSSVARAFTLFALFRIPRVPSAVPARLGPHELADRLPAPPRFDLPQPGTRRPRRNSAANSSVRRSLTLLLALISLALAPGCAWYDRMFPRIAPNLSVPPNDRVQAEELEAAQPD